MSEDFKPVLARLATGTPLSETEAENAFTIIMDGTASQAQTGAFLMGLAVRGETTEELTGAARAMRAKALHMTAPEGAIDTCGTGGDGKCTYNVSTAVAFVVAACGVPVAKHGNRAASSRSGAADVLTALGVNVHADIAIVREALWESNIAFLMAPLYHSAMRHVAPVRAELGTRTVFNLMGPLLNPCNVAYQLMGVYSAHWLEPVARTLGKLGTKRVWVVHGSDGLDELTSTGDSQVVEWDRGKVRGFTVDPRKAGLALSRPDDLTGGTPEENAAALCAIFAGTENAYRDIVALNAAAALMIAERTDSLKEGVTMACKVMSDGTAERVLKRLTTLTNVPVREQQ
ncbi:MAG: anthranilate phosphoribosyltransferase [Pseudomonadota bacterium]|nr:anthranilate phosphoribosyltransferase [Pseudomonadota bacterium]